ncbi:XrtA/PEP-CTERM system TPR-repeat protein PrsT [Sedimenticola selenatireducens]|uniref:PEP-CTERM system TPR-repeat protein PrsT n=1 Tax=Sedimenticola selenatireducens TaxID=191960 RepID=A0A2N6D035_9GAMM|nr:XrtA/PEP-CTERM system TPR-repeat protein PrsT [Sedimenticola selenatireducens]PLX63017.1 MAG: PEP-CTERM system TPR-repeat protein PrsT [Sedimenticola selenatireducens]
MNKTLRRALCLSSLLFIAGCGVVDDQQYLQNAQKFAAEGDFKSALIELKNALQQDPDNSTVRTYLGQLYLNTGNHLAAEKELKKAKELGADDNEIFPSLSQVLLQLRKLDDVLAMQADHLAPQEQGEVLAAQGMAFLLKSEFDRAIERTERAIGIAAGSAYVQVARASTYLIAEKSPIKAREQLNHAFEVDRNYAAAWSLLGDIERTEKNMQAAREAYTKSLSIRPTSLADRNKRVTVNILLNDLKQAQFDLDILNKQLPDNPGVAFSQGLVHLASGNLEDAKSAFDLALLDQDRYPVSLFYLAYVSYQQGNIAQAETHSERYFTLTPEHLPNRKLLAEIKLAKKEYDYVETLLNPVVTTANPDEGAQNILAKALLMSGKTAEGIALLNQVVERNPDSADARFRLGASLMMSGNQEEGIAQLEMAIRQDEENDQAHVYRILSYLRSRQMEKAHQAAAEFRARAPESEIPYNMIGMIYIAENDFKAAKKALEQSWKIKPGNTDAGHNLASLATLEKSYDKARDYLDGVIAAHPDNLETLIKLAEIDALEGKTQQQILRLERAMRLYPDALKPRLVLAQHYINSGNPGQVAGLIETLDAEARKQLPVMEVIASQEIAQRNFKSAEKTAKAIISRAPEAPQGYFILAQAYAGMGNLEQVKEMVEKAIQLDDHFIPARIVLLRLLVNNKDIPAIEREIAELKTFAADNENVMKVEVTLEALKGNQQQALKLAERVFDAFPNLGNMLALSRQKSQAGDNGGALKLKVDWAENHTDEYYPNLIVAISYTRLKQDDLAVKYYQRALVVSPESVLVLNNLAWALRSTDPALALIYAQKANRLKPGSVSLMDTLAMVYLANSDFEAALRTIKEVLYLEPDNPTLRYHEALINATAGNNSQAVQILTELLGKTQDFSERPDATALLDSLKRG